MPLPEARILENCVGKISIADLKSAILNFSVGGTRRYDDAHHDLESPV